MITRKKSIFMSALLLIVVAALFVVSIINSQDSQTVTNPSNEQEFENETPKEEPIVTLDAEMEVKTAEEESKGDVKEEVVKDKEEEIKKEADENIIKTEEKEPVKVTTKYVNVSSLNMRSGPNLNESVVKVLVLNESVQAESTSTDNGWVKITSSDDAGYVNAKYLSDKQIVVKKEDVQVKKVEPVKKEVTTSLQKKSEATATAEQKGIQKKEPVQKQPQQAKQPTNDADKLKTVGANNQVILVTTSGYGTSSAKIQTFERQADSSWKQVLSISGHIGKNGFATNKREGDGKTPRGKFTIGTAFGQKGNPGTKLPFRAITSDDVWVDDSNSSLYNSWQSKSKTQNQWKSAENMAIPQYNYGFVINYNTNRVPGAGSAIFFHVSSGHTLGCTGVSQSNMVSILKWLDPAKKPVIIQAPAGELGNY